MANAQVFNIAFDMDPATLEIVEPEPLQTIGITEETDTSVTVETQAGDGRTFFLRGDFFLQSETVAVITGLQLFNADSSTAATITGLNIVVDADQDIDDILDEINLNSVFGGADSIIGAALADRIFGLGGNDTVFGLGGNDTIYGNVGNDALYGNQDNDEIFGGQGDDVVFGGQGADVVYGNLQSDAVYGNLQDDVVYGGSADDDLYGGSGDDQLFGNRDNDTLFGNRGNDTLHGGGGADNFVSGPNGGDDMVLDFEDNIDRITVSGTGAQLSQQNGDTLVSLDSGDSILVLNIDMADLADDLFIV